ncbi:Site-specific DNA recombinase [Alicyclobacillus hesperidum]|uniref:Site-specific DNA recombinase n=1 Tax=Alicyclobacillus hesperidum TaxID=89784 RepID=A0A1H2V6D4_9BACL|nr:recombinase family protein [Alicyclobacillus hesperidum]SDW63810.1 Site-specific DNA recombinase [Alicyclobacillus hesperidum]
MNLEGGKYCAFYVRVSTDAQDERMQHSAAEPILRQVPPDRLLTFVDHGVSAAKVPMAKRQELQRMLALIRGGQIGTLICYERDRLARDAYEYVEIAKLLISRKVEVVFTAASARTFDGNILVEGISDIAAAYEAQAIQRRVSDAVKEYPAQLFGYKRIRGDDGFVRYYRDSKRADGIAELFDDISSVRGFDEFMLKFESHRRILHRTEAQMLKVLQTPFYAGHVQRFGTYHALPHVEPITSLQTFKAVQVSISNLAQWTGRALDNAIEGIMQPICGLCGSPMAQKSSISYEPRYECRRGGHRVNVIDISLLNAVVMEQISKRITNLDVEAFHQTCSEFIRRHVRRLESERARVIKEYEDKSLAFARRFEPGVNNRVAELALQEIESLEEQSSSLSDKIRQLQAGYSLDVRGLIDLVQHTLVTRMQDKGAVRSLASLLFSRVIVFPERIDFLAYYGKFLRNGGESHEATA